MGHENSCACSGSGAIDADHHRPRRRPGQTRPGRDDGAVTMRSAGPGRPTDPSRVAGGAAGRRRA
ncbi:MAG: hypothetical protein AVDCRST_MAG52-2423 [uncultured Blastococcus sp.]|uniref:Uncharacterized protein n=1 Tax=uncultured Blastococcus sp. TaxID=217144 RepID=A0A6J4IG97_9ACTN|nr:MAG: hypothetical protein AVDCRST_MAG52-2423 [uncultured Blastococcus sp.]